MTDEEQVKILRSQERRIRRQGEIIQAMTTPLRGLTALSVEAKHLSRPVGKSRLVQVVTQARRALAMIDLRPAPQAREV